MTTKEILGNLLLEITSKQKWYSKVFDEKIVKHWKDEFLSHSVPLNSADLFDLVIKFSQATAQGCVHLDDCPWEENGPLCEDCKEEKRKEIEADPKAFDLNPEEIPEIFESDDWISDLEFECDHRCSCLPPDFDLTAYVKYIPDGLLSKVLRNSLKEQIQVMLNHESIDWHPGSNQQVRDLVHPSMYCYVKGISQLKDGTKEPMTEEEVRYQWLPSEFQISPSGQTKITSYINNLNGEKYPAMIPLLEQTFEQFLTPLEDVLKRSIRGGNIQVITKIGTIYLDPTKPNYLGGSWHIEGMPHEHIAATCIHYLDVHGISESFLEFRKPVLIDDLYAVIHYPQSDSTYTTHHYGIEKDSHHDGQMNRYLGLVKCSEGASIVFPNSIQHRVKDFTLAAENGVGVRTILVFFVIDPSKKIVSTADVAPQQQVFTQEEAEYHRERLMFHRKYFVNELNKEIFERPYSLCEH